MEKYLNVIKPIARGTIIIGVTSFIDAAAKYFTYGTTSRDVVSSTLRTIGSGSLGFYIGSKVADHIVDCGEALYSNIKERENG